MKNYFVNFIDYIVSNEKENNDFEMISIEFAQKLVDLQDDDFNWMYWNKSDLIRTCEKPFNLENFEKVFNQSVAVFCKKYGVRYEKEYLKSYFNRIKNVKYEFQNSSQFLFISNLVLN